MKKLMIVDDEFLVRLGIASLMTWENYGYTIAAEASNGKEALEKIEGVPPDIVLTDLMMSPGDGFELIETCRDCRPHFFRPVSCKCKRKDDRSGFQ